MESVKIREAKREDCKSIISLIQELADFEKHPEGPTIGANVLEKDGFDTNPPLFECYLATIDEKVIGYALYCHNYSTWLGKKLYLEDLYVKPEFRKKHIGSMLFKAVVEKAKETHCKGLDFRVLNWNPAREFYKRQKVDDLTEKEGWHYYRMNL